MPISTYHTFEKYREATEAFAGIAEVMLFDFARHGRGHRDTICRNFVARAATISRSLLRLYEAGDYQSCWILHRSLMDRLFHLYHIAEHDTFDDFEAWSFLQQYDSNKTARSDPQWRAAAVDPVFEATPEQDERAAELRNKRPRWERPKARAMARLLGMEFLYRFGYDYASAHVHPMANDGHRDFYRITKLKPAPVVPDERVVLSNSLLVATVLVQTAMNASTLRWWNAVYDFLDELGNWLGTGSDGFKERYVQLGRRLKEGEGLGVRGAVA